MTLDELRRMVATLEDVPGNLELVSYDRDCRLRDYSMSLDLGGRDSKDKYSSCGAPVIIVWADSF